MSQDPRIFQLAFETADLPRTVHLYTEAFGFADAGGMAVCGPWMAQVQGLGDDAASMVWWMVGRQEFFQLELFAHTTPVQKPLRADWRPSDLGWTRWGLTVPDFDGAVGRLRGLGIELLTEPILHEGLRRACFRDPYVGIIVELLEEGGATPGGIRTRYFDLVPAVVYATLSVVDLDRARAFFVDTIGLTEEPTVQLHTPEMEALWGLPGAAGESFVARGGEIYLEVVRYDDPPGRPKPPDYLLSDQGFLNIGIGYRNLDDQIEALHDRVVGAGYRASSGVNGPEDVARPTKKGAYITDDQGTSVEIFSASKEFDDMLGFNPIRKFTREGSWPSAHTAPATE